MTMQSHIRRQMLAERKALTSEYINYYQPLLDRKLVVFTQQFSSIAIYSAIQNEVSVNCVANHIQHDAIALPKINRNDELIFVEYEDPNLWQKGQYNILEPTTEVVNFVPEAFIVPLTAIDYTGTRIGMGKGYYDRYLESCQDSVLVGVGWDFQLVNEVLARQSHDVPMDYFISPSYFIKF
ncbi:5-formyltetrahydrofolate cyclo-ligase [Wohlfahrtiimonas larvae]|uniref:5-formyltetrahydrofolate cyclo-ligase n=1 Tax=Wohlfahrtiimonas larvae TaxID=1157986 RepID=A0ABP9MA42_9GAMM|nr:5-formyltetrahydrofolate cyclo-ligase [Wohlfahrtiimonas larvae]